MYGKEKGREEGRKVRRKTVKDGRTRERMKDYMDKRKKWNDKGSNRKRIHE